LYKWLLQFMATQSAITKSKTTRILALATGTLVFLGLVPWLLLIASAALVGNWPSLLPRGLELAFGILCALDGLCILLWAVVSFWRVGQGTPNPVVPTQQLVVSGPYHHCRNPIQLGAIFYYLGLGTILASIVVGSAMFLLALVLGSAYHKFIEEKELAQRYGQAYEDYRRSTPFLFPRWRRKQ
jgi:protein-S-isoprenylcysteine O-methyltransferase Ste14